MKILTHKLPQALHREIEDEPGGSKEQDQGQKANHADRGQEEQADCEAHALDQPIGE